MHEAEQDRFNMELLNDYYERDMLEQEERDALIRAYREWGVEEVVHANQERGSGHEE
jgi:hypothetical protein